MSSTAPLPPGDPLPPSSPFVFYILHVEDSEAFAVLKDRDYQGPLKSPIEKALATYGVAPEMICWEVAGGVDQAQGAIERAHKLRANRVFDAVICDLQIPLVAAPGVGRDGNRSEDNRSDLEKQPNWHHGLQLVSELNSPENAKWCQSLTVMSAFADRKDVLADRTVDHERLHYHEWIRKTGDKGIENPDGLLPKFRRCLIPTEAFCHWLEHGDESTPPDESPVVIRDWKMKQILRQLIFIAGKEYTDWPLAKILLLGDAGCGKGMLARAFHRILRRLDQVRENLAAKRANRAPESFLTDRRKPFRVVNCASLVPHGHGGRIVLFGTQGFQGTDDGPGVYESTTCYDPQNQNTFVQARRSGVQGNGAPVMTGPPGNTRALLLATESSEVIWQLAGVTFLDECVELAPDLQAANLNALEEGIVVREGASRETINIGCHVILATNYDPAKLAGDVTNREPSEQQKGNSKEKDKDGPMRHDLIDRVPYVFRIPPLRERKDEIRPIIEALASRKASKPVTISTSAWGILEKAIWPERESDALIKSVRQLQMVADVFADESEITDSNLASLFAKAVAFRREGMLTTQVTYNDLRAELAKAFERLCEERIHHPVQAKNEVEYLNLDIETVRAVKCVVACKQAQLIEIQDWLNSPNKELQSNRDGGGDIIWRWKYAFSLGVVLASKAQFETVSWQCVNDLFGGERKPGHQLKKGIEVTFKKYQVQIKWKNQGNVGGPAHLIDYLRNPQAYRGLSEFRCDDGSPDSERFLRHLSTIAQKLGL